MGTSSASAIHKILRHLGLPSEIPRARPCRAPPGNETELNIEMGKTSEALD